MSRIIRLDPEMAQSPRVEEGYYIVEFDSADLIPSKTREGERTLVVRWRIAEGEERGTVIPSYYGLSERALWKLARDMRALGLLGNEPVEVEEDELPSLFSKIRGVRYRAFVTDDPQRGVSKIQSFERVVGGPPSREMPF